MTVRPAFRASLLALVTLLSVPVAVAVSVEGAAARTPACKVVAKNQPTRSKLQPAIDAAPTGATLTVTGTCFGSFTVARDLTIRKGTKAATLVGVGGRTLHVTGGTVTLAGLKLTGGSATDCPEFGGYVCGAVLLNDATTRLVGVTVSGSMVDGGGTNHVFGGTIYNGYHRTMTISRSVIANNRAVGGAGHFGDGPVANVGTMTIVRSRISGNRSSGVGAFGGALYAIGTGNVLTIVDSTFSGNVAAGTTNGQGGAVVSDQGTITIRRTLFSGNKATGADSAGGAISFESSTATVEDSTFTGNHAEAGGAIDALSAGSVTIRGSTIARNNGAAGGGIAQSVGITVTLGSTIVALNTATSGGRDCSGAFTSAGDNLVGSGQGCTGFTNGVDGDLVGTDATPRNPRLGTLAANGGPSKTLALLAGSPARNAAGAAPCDTARDQRGVKRPQGGACDIGAYEQQ
ncbi:MAG: right-handed parallel beta-helix repeat-containing protein [Chloroflexota bacterium]